MNQDEKTKLFEGQIGTFIWSLIDRYDSYPNADEDGFYIFLDKYNRPLSRVKRDRDTVYYQIGTAIQDDDSDSCYDYTIDWDPIYKVTIEEVKEGDVPE